ncbi:MAG TPA: ATP-binding protein [Bryobacteraceae bacterium]|nr:ATP-binding protein [Bryobacteraceae bacterium]
MKFRVPEARHPGYLGKRFGDLKVRLKLIVLHNLFFLVLTSSVYFTVFPLLEQRVSGARSREISLITQVFLADAPLPQLSGLAVYSYEEGSADALGLSDSLTTWLDAHPGRIYGDARRDEYLYRKNPSSGAYRKIRLPIEYYRQALLLVQTALFGVLGVIYILAVLLLELVIMPLYVYRPLHAMLNADYSVMTGDRAKEIIPASYIPRDEIGQIMLSRNSTVEQLRAREEELESALNRLENAKRSLAAQDRLASLGMLSAGVAHELNTPLAVLQGSIEKLIETVDNSSAQQRLLRMQRVATRLRSISEGLLDFARVGKPRLENVPVHPLIDEAWSLLALDEKSGTAAFENAVPADCCVMGNPDRLIQVYVNLLRNALQAIPASAGKIRVSATPYAATLGRWWSIAVEDNGPGIPEDVLPEIFEAFITTRLDSRGTGLGLTVSEGIIHQHGGTINAANNPGGGARIEIRLPEAPPNAV